MKSIIIFIALLNLAVFSACNQASENKTGTTQLAVKDSVKTNSNVDTSVVAVVPYLLQASAKDFHEHQKPAPLEFRQVHVKVLLGQNTRNYMICGEFLSKDKDNKDVWTSFATIKTSDFEQWLGAQSIGYCNEAKPVDYKEKDLSNLLMQQL